MAVSKNKFYGGRPTNSENSHSVKVRIEKRAMATRRPSHPKGIRIQEQFTFNFEDSSPQAPCYLSEGGESGRINKEPTGNYWSSTTNADNTSNALNVNFNNGNVNNDDKTNTNYVVAVRGGKRQGRLPRKDIFSFQNIYSAYLECRKRKRNTINALKFEINQEEKLLDLQDRLINRTYRPGRSILFGVTKPKLREIFAADFTDRIVHHILVRELEKIWEPRFIYDSYVCRKGKGTHKAVLRVQKFIRQASGNGTRRAYYVKLDIRNFFYSLDKDILFKIISKKLNDPKLLWLTNVVLYHDCTKNYISRDREELLARIPSHKRLDTEAPKKGLPIGNLTSQFFANLYLDRLDQYIKRELKCRWYVRYCDDFVLLGRDRTKLSEWTEKIKVFLREILDLELHPKEMWPVSVSNGIDFIGYVVHRNHILARRRVVNNLKERLIWFEKILIRAEGKEYTAFFYNYKLLDQLFCCLNSYLGHFKHANSYRLVKALWNKFRFLNYYFNIDFSSLSLKRKYPLPQIYRNMAGQYESLISFFSGFLVFFQVGRFYEMFNQQAELAGKYLRLNLFKGKGWAEMKAGFPIIAIQKYKKIAMQSLIPVLQIVERGNLVTGDILERLPFRGYLPLTCASHVLSPTGRGCICL